MKNNAINSLLLFLTLSVATILFLGKYRLKELFVLIPICLIVSLASFAYDERKKQKRSSK